MSSTTEVKMGVDWLKTTIATLPTLSTDLPGGVHRDVAPLKTVAPFGIIQHLSGQDTITITGKRVLTGILYLFKVVGTDEDIADSVYGSIDDLLSLDQVVAVDGGYIHACYREDTNNYADSSVVGITWRHSGGQYRLLIEKV